ncbi:MAG: ATP-binding protein [Candidatus Binatia bacterium]
MKTQDLDALIGGIEGRQLELRATVPPDTDLAMLVCGFLNAEGGTIGIGMGIGGEVRGVTRAGETATRIRQALSQSISPPALYTVEIANVGEREVLLLEVPEGADKPYVTDGRILLRRNDSTVAASRDEISELIARRQESGHRWERQAAVAVILADLELKLVTETAQRAATDQRWQGDAEDPQQFLSSLGLLAEGTPTNAAVVLFARQPARVLPQARARLLVAAEGKTGERFARDQLFEGPLVRLVDELAAALEGYAGGIASDFPAAEWSRRDRPGIPVSALREGAMNALVHRDYNLHGVVTIEIDAHTIRITSPGGLPDGLTPADLQRRHSSVPRNPDIAHVCFLRGFIEKIGRGTQRIVEDCRRTGLRPPKWHSTALETVLVLDRGSSSADRSSAGLSDRQREILAVMAPGDRLRVDDVRKALKRQVTERTIRTDLQKLVDSGWLRRVGQARATMYVRTDRVESQ